MRRRQAGRAQRSAPARVARSAGRIGLLLLVAYGVLVGALAGCQRQLIYFPNTPGPAALETRSAQLGMAPWLDAEGTRIGWRRPAEEVGQSGPAVVVFHGNAGHALNRMYYVHGFEGVPTSEAWDVRIFEYPGYGSRAGSPSEASILAAAEAALAALQAERGGPVLLVGESLGSGAASHLAGAHPEAIAGVVLLTPFPSLPAVGKYHYPILPVETLLQDRFDNVAALQGYAGPVAVVLAEDDRIIPAELGRQLYDRYAGPKRLWVQAGRGHNSLDIRPEAAWWAEVTAFLLDGEDLAGKDER